MEEKRKDTNTELLGEAFVEERYGADFNVQEDEEDRIFQVFHLQKAKAGSAAALRAHKETMPSEVQEEQNAKSKSFIDKLIIAHDNRAKGVFDLVMVLLVAFSNFTAIYFVAFGPPETTGEEVIDIIVEVLFGIDLILSFFQEYRDPLTYDLVQSFGSIAKNYITSYFLFDLLAIIPWFLISENLYAIRLTRLLRMPRFISMVSDQQFIQFLKKVYKGGETKDEQVESHYLLLYVYKIFKLLLVEMILTYMLALIFYTISNEANPSSATKTFLKSNNYYQYSITERIIRCMYFILTTLTSVGYGDVSPISNEERIFIIFVFVIGIAYYSYIMGNFIEIIGSYDRKIGVQDKCGSLDNWLASLAHFNNHQPLDNETTAEIVEHFKYFWTENKLAGLSADDEYFRSLPKACRLNLVINYLFSEVFWNFRRFFCIGDKHLSTFLYEMAFGFLPRKFKKGKPLYREDDDVEELYLILKGYVTAGFTLKGRKYPGIDLGPNNHIGDYYILSCRKSEFYYDAKTDVEVLGINRDYFTKVLENHSKKWEMLEKRSLNSYFTDIRTVIISMRKKVLRRYNMVNPYEEISYAERIEKPILEANKKDVVPSSTIDEVASTKIEGKLEIYAEEARSYKQKILDLTEKYKKEFDDIIHVLDNPAEELPID